MLQRSGPVSVSSYFPATGPAEAGDAPLRAAAALATHTLTLCAAPAGLMASGARLGHHQVWARDAMMAALGARLLPYAPVQEALRASVRTLKDKAAANGAIPNNVDARSGRANFRAYADGGLWWIIASQWIQPDLAQNRRILAWYACQDVDQSGLLSQQEGADWQDLFCTRGKSLTLNCLYIWALDIAARQAESAGAIEDAESWTAQAGLARRHVREHLWYKGDGDALPHLAHGFSTSGLTAYDSLGRRRWLQDKRILRDEAYFLPYLGFRTFGEWFDTLGNLLAVLTGVADTDQGAQIFSFIERHGLDARPLPAIYPAVQPGEPDWRDYYGQHNLPHLYHNGGVWPFIGGFYVAALVQQGRMEAATVALGRLAELLLAGTCNEWHRGDTGAAGGVQHQAWTAGLYLWAAEAVASQTVELYA